MTRNCFEVDYVAHNYEKYSRFDIENELRSPLLFGEEDERRKRSLQLLDRHYDQFRVLYCLSKQAMSNGEDNDKMTFVFHERPYERPAIETEAYDTEDKDTQLELECKFEDGTAFGLSALRASPRTSDETLQMRGQIRIPDETIATLNEEKLGRIFEFCHRYGFSTFGLNLPMKDGEIDVDAKLAELYEKYQELQAKDIEENPGPEKPSEDEHDAKGIKEEDYHVIVDGVEPEKTAGKEEAHTSIKEEDEVRKPSSIDVGSKAAKKGEPVKKQLNVEDVAENINKLLTNGWHKKKGLSYWMHEERVDGRRTYVFSVYDKEDRDNYKKDGLSDPKNPHLHVPRFSHRLYISQDKNGKFYFGYGMPGHKPIDASMAGDFVGEIKKAGITHLKLTNVPNYDQNTWMIACAQKGIVPRGVSISIKKAENMLKEAKINLSTQEYAEFEERLMEQWEDNARKSGKELSISDKEYIRKRKNEAKKLQTKQDDLLQAAEFEEKFENFREAYDASDGLYNIVDSAIRKGSLNKRNGAAGAIAAVHSLARTFDIVVGDDNNLDMTFGQRLNQLLANPLKDETGTVVLIRLNEAEKRALSVIPASKRIKDLTKEDYQVIYKALYPRQLRIADEDIVDRIRKSNASNTKRAVPILLGDAWGAAKGQLTEINRRLKRDIGVDILDLPETHYGLFYERSEEILAADKKKAEASKVDASSPMPKSGPERDSR